MASRWVTFIQARDESNRFVSKEEGEVVAFNLDNGLRIDPYPLDDGTHGMCISGCIVHGDFLKLMQMLDAWIMP